MKKLFIANWKSNKSREQVERWMDQFQESIIVSQANKTFDSTVVICPPMPSLMFVSNRLLDQKTFQNVLLGVQDISQFPSGSYTGAVSARNLEGFNVRYAIVGHSERRKYFHETHQDVALKIEQCLENSIRPILCIDADQAAEQFTHIPDEQRSKIILAYEPVEYIGGTETQPVDQILKVIQEFKESYSPKQIIYGGSVNAESITPMLEHDEISGFLVGGASLEVESFISLLNN